MNNKDKKTILANGARKITVDIDYDRLGESIVKAQMKASDKERTADTPNKIGFFRAVWGIIKGERSKDGQLLSVPFALVIEAVFRIMSLASIGLCILLAKASITTIKEVIPTGQYVDLFISAVIAVFLVLCSFLYAILFWGAANDVKEERDRDYIINVFCFAVFRSPK